MAEVRMLFLTVTFGAQQPAEQVLEQWVNAGWRIVACALQHDPHGGQRLVMVYTMQKD